ncbi:MAG: hypothetical protein K2K49_06580 [Duncaniella sp.]|nr:hypothetical protein [Duncaniella sp.]
MSKASVKAEIDRKKAYVAAKREEVKLWRARKTGKEKAYKEYCDGQIRMKQADIANRMAEIARLRERLKYEK